MDLTLLGTKGKKASYELAKAAGQDKNDALAKIAEGLIKDIPRILEANQKDVEKAKANNISSALLDRLILNENRIHQISDSLVALIALPDPVGEVLEMKERPNGLRIGKQRVPIGVIGMIYESRPNVTADAAGLCIKSGNAVILRGGSDAIHSNIAIVRSIRNSLKQSKLPEDCVQIIEDTSREIVREFMKLNRYVDILIPRGGAGLIKSVIENATIPVIETGTGNCHVYVDSSANLEMALNIIVNAKTQRPGVCNAAETLLVSEDRAEDFLPMAKKALIAKKVQLRCCEKSYEMLKGDPLVVQATEEDWETEFLDYILAVKIVKDVDEAIEHINRYGTMHSEAIVTESYTNANKFLKEVDAAAVYVNASTRFTDGGEFGFGAEIGISTQKLHARGPMGLAELTTIKYIIYGNGQVR
ncbi:MAG: glutamate-5-semialdehyde dehydrogenase [Clostridia bacterium]|jgi:glutamate-5-semialdehyde dehydrogenase|nr:glutamate-5-semialdehyde dehydrogenase [Clostridiaceae bacterium]